MPIPFHLVYQTESIDERMTYALRVRISYDNKLEFINTSSVPVLTRGAPNHADVIVEPVGG